MSRAEPSTRIKRQDARRAAGSKTKPYTRISKNLSPSSSEEITWPLETGYSDSMSKPGFPTYDQYKQLEAAYLASLSPRKRDKALITQAMFDDIWDILHDPDTRDIQTAQFRFWVRKMFVLSDPQPTEVFTAGDSSTQVCSVPVILHENRPVAIKEQLYELFAYCHGLSNHGGRDKTCGVIRQHYSWVPKELTAQFVKACPTCTMKRSGNPDLVAMVQGHAQLVARYDLAHDLVPDSFVAPYFSSGLDQDVVSGSQADQPADSTNDLFHNHLPEANFKNLKPSWPASEGPLDSFTYPAQWNEPTHMLSSSQPVNSSTNFAPRMSSSDLIPPAMVREVSLFNGIPNMWNVSDLESLEARARAHNAMVDQRTGIAALLPPGGMPRVPSIVFTPNGLFSGLVASHLPRRAPESGDTKASGIGPSLPPLMTALENGTLGGEEPSWCKQVDSADALPPSLQPLKLLNPQGPGSISSGYSAGTDPTLLNDHNSNDDNYAKDGQISEEQFDFTKDLGIIKTPINSPKTTTSNAAYMTGAPLSPTKSLLIRQTTGPAPLNLAALQTFNFMRHRDSDSRSPTTPSSAGSCYSQLSPFDTASSTSSNPSPFATALPTPTDEHQKTVAELAEETNGLLLGNKGSEGNEHPWLQEGDFPTIRNLAEEAATGIVP